MITVFHQQRNGTFIRVAKVNTHRLETAWRLTNHINWDWTTNHGVEAFTERPRSSMVGDIFYTHGNGNFHRVASFGFNPVALNEQITFTFADLRTLIGAT